jgi:ATP adenylyltransferase
MMSKCFFCSIDKKKILIESKLAYAFIDEYPVTRLHCLIVPKRHFASFFSINDDELLEIKKLLVKCKEILLKKDNGIDGFNIGINDGIAAGQSVFHLHVHLIPRRKGDLENPKGGVRGVIPKKRGY